MPCRWVHGLGAWCGGGGLHGCLCMCVLAWSHVPACACVVTCACVYLLLQGMHAYENYLHACQHICISDLAWLRLAVPVYACICMCAPARSAFCLCMCQHVCTSSACAPTSPMRPHITHVPPHHPCATTSPTPYSCHPTNTPHSRLVFSANLTSPTTLCTHSPPLIAPTP